MLATNNAKKLTELRRIVAAAAPGRRRCSPWPTSRPTRSRPRPSRPSRATRCSRRGPASRPPGCRRWPTTPGLAVDRLNGMPGVRSARWSGADATDAEQQRPAAAPAVRPRRAGRSAAPSSSAPWPWCCPTAPSTPGAAVMPGHLTTAPAGEHGFGYDPLFVADGHDVHHGPAGPGRQGRHQPPRPGHPGAGARAGGRAAADRRTRRQEVTVKTYLDLVRHVLDHGVRQGRPDGHRHAQHLRLPDALRPERPASRC